MPTFEVARGGVITTIQRVAEGVTPQVTPPQVTPQSHPPSQSVIVYVKRWG